jgi:hypothetical protein
VIAIDLLMVRVRHRLAADQVVQFHLQVLAQRRLVAACGMGPARPESSH